MHIQLKCHSLVWFSGISREHFVFIGSGSRADERVCSAGRCARGNCCGLTTANNQAPHRQAPLDVHWRRKMPSLHSLPFLLLPPLYTEHDAIFSRRDTSMKYLLESAVLVVSPPKSLCSPACSLLTGRMVSSRKSPGCASTAQQQL